MNARVGRVASASLSEDFLDFITSLNEKHVQFVLVGGYALGVHGVVRATRDIDFLYRRTPDNVGRLCAALQDFGAPPEVIDEEALMTPEIVTQFGLPPNRIDLLNAIDGVSFDEVWKGVTRTTIEGQVLLVIGLEELRRNKAATARSRDREDLKRLGRRSRRKKR